MAKINPTDIISEIIESNNFGKFIIVEYLGKTKSKIHEYKIKFIDTGNFENVTRNSIQRKSCVDTEKKNLIRKEKELNKRKELKRKNSIRGKEKVICNNKHCRILSLDQALNNTGISYFIDTTLIEYDLFQTNQSYSYIEKIISVRDKVSELIDKYKIDVLAVEDTYVYMNVEVYKKLSILVGVLQILAYEKNVKIVVANAIMWKKYANILQHKGREAQKNASKIKIRERYDIYDVPDDISDSILIGSFVSNNCIEYVNQGIESASWD